MRGNIILSVITVLSSVFFLIQALQLPPSRDGLTLGPGGWPAIILILMIILGAALFIRTIRANKVSATSSEDGLLAQSEQVEAEFADSEVYKTKFLYVLGVIVIYLLLLSYVGFVLTTPFMLIAIALIIGIKRWLPIILSSVIGTACLTYLFPILLKISLPRGAGFFREISLLFY